MKNIILLLFILFSNFAVCQQEIFQKGNDLYAKKEFEEAVIFYDSLLIMGFESSELYLNIANCYYKLSKWPYAILYYEKSLKLKERKEARENLELTNKKIFDYGKIIPIPELLPNKLWKKFTKLFSIKFWQYLSIIFAWLFFILFLLNKFFNKPSKVLSICILLVSLFFLFITMSVTKKDLNLKEAIIFESEVLVKSAPDSDGLDKFIIHSGTKIELLDKINMWSKIKISNGKTGWILESSFREF